VCADSVNEDKAERLSPVPAFFAFGARAEDPAHAQY
jgi:hypothetical protein